MFVGDYVHTLDGKNRLIIPAKFQPLLSMGLYIAKSMQRAKTLNIFTKEEFEARSRAINTLPMSDPDANALRRHWFSSASDLIPDSQGRIVLPEKLREYIGVKGGEELALIGLSNYIEVLSAQDWQRDSAELDKRVAESGSAIWAKFNI
jgi:MraZ protein